VKPEFRVLLLPGWLNSDAEHWQSRWQAAHGFERVQQADWQWPKRGDWMAQLEETVLSSDQAAVLVAHSLGCQLVAAWAAHSQHTARVHAALLVAPPDTARADMPPQLAGWRQIVNTTLPLATHVLYSSDDPFCAPARALEMAGHWGATSTCVGKAGHINAQSNLGDWPAGLAALEALVARA
jgi:uncharacterized protein